MIIAVVITVKQLLYIVALKNIQGLYGIWPRASPDWAMKTHMLWADHFIKFIFTYDTNEMWNGVDLNCQNIDEMEMWSSQLQSQFKRLQILGQKFFSELQWCTPYWSAPSIYIWVFIAQLEEHCSTNREAMGSTPVEALKFFFRAKICNCLNCDYNCDDHISIPAVQINFISQHCSTNAEAMGSTLVEAMKFFSRAKIFVIA